MSTPNTSTPLTTLDSARQNVPSAQVKNPPPSAPVIKGHKQQLITMLNNVSAKMTPDNLGQMIEDDLLKALMELHSSMNSVEHPTILDWMESELDDLLNMAKLIFQTFAKEFTYQKEQLYTTYATISTLVSNVAQSMSMNIPFSGIGSKNQVLNMFAGFPDVLLLTLVTEILKVDLSPLEALNTAYSKASPDPTIKEMAYAVAVLKILSSVLKYMRTATPLNLSIGLNMSVGGSVVGRASAQADISAGIDEGAGVSVPLIGVGGDAGGGAGNGTIFEAKPLTVSITGLLVGDLQAGCDFAAALLNGQINIKKAETAS